MESPWSLCAPWPVQGLPLQCWGLCSRIRLVFQRLLFKDTQGQAWFHAFAQPQFHGDVNLPLPDGLAILESVKALSGVYSTISEMTLMNPAQCISTRAIQELPEISGSLWSPEDYEWSCIQWFSWRAGSVLRPTTEVGPENCAPGQFPIPDCTKEWSCTTVRK